jgi:hypothetical protein
MTDAVVIGANKLYQGISRNAKFSPTARKFHYIFNLRDPSRMVENIASTKPDK